MLALRFISTAAFALLACVALAGCGGGDSNTSAPAGTSVVPVAPSPTPAPTATPTRAPNEISFSVFEVGVDTDSQGTILVSPPSEPNSVEVRISDPDASAATVFEELNLNGNETLVTNRFGSKSGASFTTNPATFMPITHLFTQGNDLPRRVPGLSWSGSAANGPVLLPLIESAEKLPNTNATVGKLPRHGRLLEVGSPDARAIRVFGSKSPIQSVPVAGTRRYVGEVFGTVYPTDDEPAHLVGDAIIHVSFEKKQATGLIKFSQYERANNLGLALTVEFVADIVDGKLVTRSIVVTGTGKALQSGSVAGGFFGATAANFGFTLSAQGPTGIAILGAVLERSD